VQLKASAGCVLGVALHAARVAQRRDPIRRHARLRGHRRARSGARDLLALIDGTRP
jgi:hypothetical protein